MGSSAVYDVTTLFSFDVPDMGFIKAVGFGSTHEKGAYWTVLRSSGEIPRTWPDVLQCLQLGVLDVVVCGGCRGDVGVEGGIACIGGGGGGDGGDGVGGSVDGAGFFLLLLDVMIVKISHVSQWLHVSRVSPKPLT